MNDKDLDVLSVMYYQWWKYWWISLDISWHYSRRILYDISGLTFRKLSVQCDSWRSCRCLLHDVFSVRPKMSRGCQENHLKWQHGQRFLSPIKIPIAIPFHYFYIKSTIVFGFDDTCATSLLRINFSKDKSRNWDLLFKKAGLIPLHLQERLKPNPLKLSCF